MTNEQMKDAITILDTYGLTLIDGPSGIKIVSKTIDLGSVSFDAVTDLMFYKNLSRHQALNHIAEILNKPIPESVEDCLAYIKKKDNRT